MPQILQILADFLLLFRSEKIRQIHVLHVLFTPH